VHRGLKRNFLALLPEKVSNTLKSVKNKTLDGYALKSYSQEGEDIILQFVFRDQDTGFYVDIGAHHPKRFSNTFKLYKMGWRGINVDPLPGCMEAFRRQRPRDINLEVAVSDRKEELPYYVFEEPALNGFSREISQERDGVKGHRILSTVLFETQTLAEILDRYLPKGQSIDFFSIDVEGFELRVLKSNDWQKYRPNLVLIEILDVELPNIAGSSVYQFMLSQGYWLFAKSVTTHFFRSPKS
jgi:FkbM family methyltransferase